ncbi:hypothetical protein A6R68_22710, partial [Neotoma lepida]
ALLSHWSPGLSIPYHPSPHQLVTQGSVAQAVTSEENKGDFFIMFLASSLAGTTVIYLHGRQCLRSPPKPSLLSGYMLGGMPPLGQAPPFIALGNCCLFSVPQELPTSSAMGTEGTRLGAAVVGRDALQHYTGGNLTVTGSRETASIFATYPSPYLSLISGFLDQVLGTWMLTVGLLAVLDRRNKGVPAGLQPVVAGLLILAIGLSMGVNCGFPLTLPGPWAHSSSPTLLAGGEVFSAGNGWWWVPVVAPVVGSTLSTATYQLLVTLHHPEDPEPVPRVVAAQLEASDLGTPAQLECKL